MALRKFSVVLVVAAAFHACAAAANPCADLRAPEARIAACSKDIDSGKMKGHDQAVNYNNRGNAYFDRRDYDRAIADYDAAIQLDPSYSGARINRNTATAMKNSH